MDIFIPGYQPTSRFSEGTNIMFYANLVTVLQINTLHGFRESRTLIRMFLLYI